MTEFKPELKWQKEIKENKTDTTFQLPFFKYLTNPLDHCNTRISATYITFLAAKTDSQQSR